MSDVQCDCGHMRGRHVEILSHHSEIHGQRWCRDCECKRFKPMKRDATEGRPSDPVNGRRSEGGDE